MRRRLLALGTAADPASDDARMSLELFGADEAPAGRLALLVHGRNGAAHAPHMLKLARAYLAAGYVVAAPNCPGSDGNDSAGDGADFTIGRLVRDAARAARWLMTETGRAELGWSGGRLALCGHSMGAYAVAHLAAGALFGRAAHLMMVSPFTSGARQLAARVRYHPDGLAVLARELPEAITDWPRHDIFAFIDRLALPAAVVAGARDIIAPLENVRELVMRLPVHPEFLVLPAAAHCLEGGRYASELGALVRRLDQRAGLGGDR